MQETVDVGVDVVVIIEVEVLAETVEIWVTVDGYVVEVAVFVTFHLCTVFVHQPFPPGVAATLTTVARRAARTAEVRMFEGTM